MYTPLHSYCVIEVIKESEVRPSGIITASAGKPTSTATIISISEELSDSSLKVGGTVVVNKFAPLEIKVGDDSVTIIDFADIYLVEA